MAEPSKRTPIEPGLIARIGNGARGFISGVTGATWFGPMQPMAPGAPPDTGPRRFDYPVGYNTRITPRADSAVSFAQLRSMADAFDVLRLVIETRKDQVCRTPWTVRSREKTRGAGTSLNRAGGADTAAIDRMTDLLWRPDSENDWQTWIRMLLEDLFVIDAVSIVPVRNRGGQLLRLDLIDGGTITRKINADGRTPTAPSVAYQQVLHGIGAIDLTTEDLIYRPRNRRTNRVYGFPPVEQIIMAINLALRRQVFALTEYTEGSVPEALVQVPETWTPDQITQFQSWFDGALAGNLAARRRMTFIPQAGQIDYPKAAVLKDEMDEWLARIVCFAFSIPPTPFVKQMNRATAQTAQETATSEGLEPLLEWLQSLINDIIWNVAGEKSVEFAFDSETSPDPLTQAQIDKIRVDAGLDSVDEIRARDGLEPIGMGNAIITATGPIPIGAAADAKREQKAKSAADRAAAAPAPQAPSGATKPPTDKDGDDDDADHDVGKLAKVDGDGDDKQAERAAAIEAALRTDFAKAKRTVAAKAAAGFAQDELIAVLEGMDWSGVAEAAKPQLQMEAEAASIDALHGLQIASYEVSAHALSDAELYASERAAEMVGMKSVDGELVANQNAHWAITATTRDGLRTLIENSIEAGDSTQALAKAIRGSYLFSDARAQMIARTEIAMAHSAGTLAGWKRSGVVKATRWVLASTHDSIDECNLNAAAGERALGKQYPTGDLMPPAHPNCKCALTAVIKEPGK